MIQNSLFTKMIPGELKNYYENDDERANANMSRT